MAKKTKRSVPSSSPRAASVTATAASPAVPSTPISSRRASGVEFNPDYSHIIHDLKRIGILASGFFVILIVLALFPSLQQALLQLFIK